jgi:hypothetical protein
MKLEEQNLIRLSGGCRVCNSSSIPFITLGLRHGMFVLVTPRKGLLFFFSFYICYRDFNLTYNLYVLGTLLSKSVHLMSLVMSGNMILTTTLLSCWSHIHLFLNFFV